MHIIFYNINLLNNLEVRKLVYISYLELASVIITSPLEVLLINKISKAKISMHTMSQHSDR